MMAVKSKSSGASGRKRPTPQAKLAEPAESVDDSLVAIVVPARMQSERLPEKCLLSDTGMPLVCHTIARALESRRATDVGLVTDHDKIRHAVRKRFSSGLLAYTVLSPASCGSNRVGQWLQITEGWDLYHVVVNLQCDEPCIDGRDLDNLISACGYLDKICTLVAPLLPGDKRNHSVVKAWVAGGHVAAFSRGMGSSVSGARKVSIKRHLGVYAVPRRLLHDCFRMNLSRRAKEQSLEQLTWMDQGENIVAVNVKHSADAVSVNTPEDYQEFLEWYKNHDRCEA